MRRQASRYVVLLLYSCPVPAAHSCLCGHVRMLPWCKETCPWAAQHVQALQFYDMSWMQCYTILCCILLSCNLICCLAELFAVKEQRSGQVKYEAPTRLAATSMYCRHGCDPLDQGIGGPARPWVQSEPGQHGGSVQKRCTCASKTCHFACLHAHCGRLLFACYSSHW